MANKPELSIKVGIDPVLDGEKLIQDVEQQVKDIKKLPPVPIEPDTSKFKQTIEDNLGGPYEVYIKPTLIGGLSDQVNAAISDAQDNAPELKVKLDVKDFGNNLSKQLKEQLRGVNRTLSNYLKEMQTNLALANKATYGLFSGGNRNVPVDSIFDEISKKDVKKAQTLSRQLNDIYSEMPKLKETGKISTDSDIKSIDQMSKSLIDLSNSLSLMSKAWDEADESLYNNTYKDFEKTYDFIKDAIAQLEELYNAPGALKNLNIKGSVLKNFIDNAKGGLEAISNFRGQGGDYSVFSKSVEDYQDLLDYASTFTHLNDLIGKSISRSQNELEGLKKAEQEAMGAGVPIDPSILDANTQKIIKSIGDVSAAMTELETKSKNFSDNLTVEVDKNVTNIESRVNQLIALIGILPNGEKNLPEGEKPKNKPAKPKKQNTDTNLNPENKSKDESTDSTATIKKITFDVDIEKLQEAVDALFAKVSAPIGFKPAEGAIAAVKKTLEESLNSVEILNAIALKQTDNKDTDSSAQSIPVKGHITITDADVSSDVKNPVDIPVKAALKKKDIVVPKTPVEIKIKAEITDTDVKTAAEKPKKKSKKKADSVPVDSEQLSFDSPELVVPKEEQKPVELPLPETPNYTKPSETLDDYRDSVGAAAGIQEYFAKEVDNATASLGFQSETLKALKQSLDDYTGSIDGIEKFAKAEKELDRLKKKLAQQPAQPASQPAQPNNQPPAPIKPNNNPKPGNNSQPPAPPTPPNNQPPNNGGNNGSGNNPPVESQQKLEQALERILIKMIKAQNKADTSGDKDYGRNVAEQVKWQGELHDRAQEKIDELNANYPGWEKGKSWQRHGENIAYARNDYSTAREDKQDLDTVQKLGKELQHNLKLREELHDIDKNVEPVKYQNKQDDINKSKAEIARLRSEAKTKGLNTNEVTSDFLKSAAELQERMTNKAAAKAKADADDWLDTAKKDINEAKNAYISAQKEIDKLDEQATQSHDKQTQADIATEKKLWETKRDNAEKTINGYLGGNADKYATDANSEIDSVLNRANIKDSIAAEKETAAEERKNITQYEKLLKKKYDLQKQIADAHQNTDTSVWNQQLSDAEAEMQSLYQGFNWFAKNEVDLVEGSYKAVAANKDNLAKDKKEADYVKEIVSNYKTLTSLENKRSSLFKPEDSDRLNDIDAAIKRVKDNITSLNKDASKAGFNLTGNKKISDEKANFDRAKKISDREFTKSQTDYNNAQTEKENTKLLTDYNNQLQTTLDIMQEIQKIDQNKSPVNYADAQRRLAESKAETARLGANIKGKKLTGSADFIKANTEYVAGYKNLQEDIKNKAADNALRDQTKTLKENTDLLERYNRELTKQYKLYEDLKKVDPNNAPEQAARKLAFDNQKALVDDLQKQIVQKGLNTDPGYIQRNNQYIMDVAGFDKGQDIKAANTAESDLDKQISHLQTLLKEKYDLIAKVFKSEDNTDKTAWSKRIAEIKTEVEAGKNTLIQAGRQADVDVLDSYEERLKASSDDMLNKSTNKSVAKAQADYVKDITSQYSQLESLYKRRVSLFKPDQVDNLKDIDDEIKRINTDLAKTYAEAKQNGYDLTGNADIQESIDSLSRQKKISKRDFAKNQAQYDANQVEDLFKEYERLTNKLGTYGSRRAGSIGSDNTQAQVNALNDYIDAQTKLNKLESEFSNRGFLKAGSNEWQRTYDLMEKRKNIEKAVEAEVNNRIDAEQEAIRVQDADRISLLNYIKTVEKYKDRLEQDNNTDASVYGDSVKMSNAGWDLLDMLNKNPDNKDQIAYLWGQKYNIQGVTDLESAFKALAVEAAKAGIKVQDLRTETEKFRADTQAKTNIANLQSQLSDYLAKFPKVSSGLADEVQKLQTALADPSAYKNAGKLKQAMAELRSHAKQLGLESENLIDKFKNLFGQHLSTMITMAALHQMQGALQVVYQNVVEIDTAMTELRKVSEYTGKSLEEYMGRAAEQAQKLGVSISDYISSTADWKRLGYSDEDAESMATYSTLLKNVGDDIDDVNTSSSYLIATLQGFGLLAKDAESVVDQIDKVANTEPITAQAIGEILTRSAASMKAANNDLAETIALGTSAYSVIQNAETVGTTLKSVSMYLRAAKSELEDAGESADGCANSVSELRSELKSLTGVDIMIDNKNFKSTYQILKELSQVWDSLSDVTQANVTEMIGGKISYPYVQQCA